MRSEKSLFGYALIVCIVMCTNSWGDVFYICADAAGNNAGTDWTNAYTDFSAAGLSNNSGTGPRGDTFYVAGGDRSYSSIIFKNGSSPGQSIHIKKATEQAHGTATGWRSDYGAKQAKFRAPLRFDTDDWVFDGVTGGGPGSWDEGYGFKIFDSIAPQMTKCIRLYNASNITVRHTNCIFEGNLNGATTQDLDNIYLQGTVANAVFSYCAFQYAGRDHVFLGTADGVTVEYCYHRNNRMCSSQHAQSWESQGSSNNIICRHNFFRGCCGTGVIVLLAAGIVGTSSDWEIYGNIFYNDARGYTTDGVVAVINGQAASNWKICNNTFVDMQSQFVYTGIAFSQSGATSSGNVIYNNVWYNCDSVRYSGGGKITSDYSLCIKTKYTFSEPHVQTGLGDPFVNYTGLDFRPSAPTLSGQTLAAPLTTDMYGNVRGADGTWDRGAIEFTANTGIGIKDQRKTTLRGREHKLFFIADGPNPVSRYHLFKKEPNPYDVRGRIYRSKRGIATGIYFIP